MRALPDGLTTFDEDLVHLGDGFDVRDLLTLADLTTISLHSWRPGLAEYLSEAPGVRQLGVDPKGMPVVDLSSSHLEHLGLGLGLDGVRLVKLPETIRTLWLAADVRPQQLVVDAPNGGASLTLREFSPVLDVVGLSNLLRFEGRDSGHWDTASIARAFPGLRHPDLDVPVGLPPARLRELLVDLESVTIVPR